MIPSGFVTHLPSPRRRHSGHFVQDFEFLWMSFAADVLYAHNKLASESLIRVFTSKNWGFAPNPGRCAATQGLRPWTPDRLFESLPGSSVYAGCTLAGGLHV